jgi:DNA-binding FadR family transcriptional regulator
MRPVRWHNGFVPQSVTTSDGNAPKAAAGVANILRRRIITGEVPVGGWLPPENQLLQEFDVSRPTLRAALRILESEQLVTVRRGSRGGAWVSAPTEEVLARRAGVYMQYHGISLDEVHRARAVIEPPAVRIVAERADPADADVLEAMTDAEEAVIQERAAFRSAALNFHRTIVNLSRNKTLIVFASMIHGVIDANATRYQTATAGKYRQGAERHIEHLKVIELIRAGRADEAESLWAEHLELARQVLLKEGGSTTVVDVMS